MIINHGCKPGRQVSVVLGQVYTTMSWASFNWLHWVNNHNQREFDREFVANRRYSRACREFWDDIELGFVAFGD